MKKALVSSALRPMPKGTTRLPRTGVAEAQQVASLTMSLKLLGSPAQVWAELTRVASSAAPKIGSVAGAKKTSQLTVPAPLLGPESWYLQQWQRMLLFITCDEMLGALSATETGIRHCAASQGKEISQRRQSW